MINVKLICVGKLKEAQYSFLCDEYIKRLKRYCAPEIIQLEEQRLPDKPSQAQISAALERESTLIRTAIPNGAYTIALCVEGNQITSTDLAEKLESITLTSDKICFIVGGSFGLDEKLKKEAKMRLSFSKMTFPHHLFRVMLLEQIYRGFTINAGTAYHK